MCSAELLDTKKSFTFSKQQLFTVNKNLLTAHGHTRILPKVTANKCDMWKIKPPDFSPKLYCTLNVPRIKIKTLDPTELLYGGARKTYNLDKVPRTMFQKEQKKIIKRAFITSYKPPDLLELELQFVKLGQFPKDLYQNPKLHNFRPVSLQYCYNFLLTL